MSDVVGYFVWTKSTLGPRYSKYLAEALAFDNKAERDEFNAKLIKQYPLNAEQFAQPIDTLQIFYPCPAPEAMPDPVITKVSTFARISRMYDESKEKNDLTGYTIVIDDAASGPPIAFNVGAIDLTAAWNRGARVKLSIELIHGEPIVDGAEVLVPSPVPPKAPGAAVVEAVALASGYNQDN